MVNLPKKLRQQLDEYTKPQALTLACEQTSSDGTIKRAYRLASGELIESVLMAYRDGRYTACISSQAGCAQGCVFCATGQMGFQKQLTDAEIYEQVYLFQSLLKKQDKRLSNIVFMGMGEPLANYKNVKKAIHRITESGIGARKITVSTVGIVPMIRKLLDDHEMPQVRLAVSLHCATDDRRSALLPANQRYGGLEQLMTTLKEYTDTTKRRISLEWALIHGENDSIETARELGQLLERYELRRDIIHVNVIPLNPTNGYSLGPSQQRNVDAFCQTLEREFGVACTPRVRRGIDIDAGCGQLKSQVLKQEQEVEVEADELEAWVEDDGLPDGPADRTSFAVDADAVDFENEDDYEDPEFSSLEEQAEARRLIALVKDTTISTSLFEKTRPKSSRTVRIKKKKNRRRQNDPGVNIGLSNR